MKVSEALLIEGGSQFSVLCYGVFQAGELDAALEFARIKSGFGNSRVHSFLGDGWLYGLLLDETLVSSAEEITQAVAGALARMLDVEACRAAVCMYDGAFGHFDDIFAPQLAPQTYAFSFSRGEPVIALDEAVLESKEWSSVIAVARTRL